MCFISTKTNACNLQFGLPQSYCMPTCWDGNSLGDDNDHKSHIAYALDGKVNGACPSGFDKRVPQTMVSTTAISSVIRKIRFGTLTFFNG